MHRAVLLHKIGLKNEALLEYNVLLGRAPNNTTLITNRALLLEQMNKRDEVFQ